MIKVKRWQYIALYNILLPFVLTVAFLLRVNFASFVYLVFCLLIPNTISSNSAKYPGHPRRYLLCLALWALLCLCVQIGYNFMPKMWLKSTILFDIARSPRRKAIEFRQPDECKYLVSLLAQVGLGWVRFDSIQPLFAAFAPDALVAFTCTALYARIKALRCLPIRKLGVTGERDSSFTYATDSSDGFEPQEADILHSETFHNVVFCALTCLSGCIYPCFLSAPYFIIFLFFATSWAFHYVFPRSTWASLRRFVHSFTFAHLCILYVYQLPNVNEQLPQTFFISRLLGLIQYVPDPCNNITKVLPIKSWVWPEVCYPFLIFTQYWVTATQLNIEQERHEFYLSDLLNSSSFGNESKLMMGKSNDDTLEDVNPLEIKDTLCDSTESKWLKARREIQKRMPSLLGILRGSSYIICLLIMIAWSLLYHSWSTFVLLITACLVWMYSKTQKMFYRLIPFIAIYAEILLFCNFIFAFPLTQDELPDENPVLLRQLGLEKPRDHAPFLDLMLKVGFNFVFWVTLYMRDEDMQLLETELWRKLSHFSHLESIQVGQSGRKKRSEKQQNLLEKFSTVLHLVLSNFWIFFVLAMLLAISVQDPAAFYRIIYMSFFLVFVNLFQISFRKWRRFMYAFWMILIGYCLFLLTLLYTYQFHGISDLYVEQLGLAEDVTRSLGLERFSSSRLLFRLMTPICFLIFSLIQVNYCHDKIMHVTQHWEDEVYGLKLRFLMAKLKQFYRQTNYLEEALQIMSQQKSEDSECPPSPTTSNQPILLLPSRVQVKQVIGKLEIMFKRVIEFRLSIWNIFWRVTEIHFTKLIAFYMVYVALSEVSILNFLLVISAEALLYSERFSTEILNLSSALSSSIVILKMLYQLEFIKAEHVSRTCHNEILNNTVTVQFGDWYGLSKTDSILTSTQNHLVLVLLLALKTVIHIRQFMHRKMHKLEEPPHGIVFPNMDRSVADQDFFHCTLYLTNYLFHRFGVEICMIVTAVTIGYRNDFLSVLYAAVLLGLFLLERREKSHIWPYYLVFLYGLFVVQYLSCLGLPDYFCWSYPWDVLDRNITAWFYLPSSVGRPNSHKLFAIITQLSFVVDFAQLLCASCQLFAFRLEEKHGNHYAGGSNDETNSVTRARQFLLSFNMRFFMIEPSPKKPKNIAVPDFISGSRHSFLDKLKQLVFLYFYWATLSIIFIAGTTRVTIFSAGYLFSAFLFLWKGNSMFFLPILPIIRLWDMLILYNLIVIFMKVLLQVVGCIFLSSLYNDFCWFIQLFGIACNNFANLNIDEREMTQILSHCEIPHRESGIFYDGLCFAFLLFQRRIFGSEYFKHVIVELHSQKFFAARGAELISLIRHQEVQEAAEKERNVLAKVKCKMQKIKRKHEKESRRPIEEVVENLMTPTTITTPTNPLSDENMSSSSASPFPTVDDAATKNIGKAEARGASASTSTSSWLKADTNQLRFRKISAPLSRRKPFKPLKIPSVVEENENEDNSEEDWSLASSGDHFDSSKRKKAALDSGVKGLGPLQLLNFAFQRGALSDAMRESNEIEATHDLLERQMEETYGMSDYQSIRRAILKQKARQKTKADYDENTFDEDAVNIGGILSYIKKATDLPYKISNFILNNNLSTKKCYKKVTRIFSKKTSLLRVPGLRARSISGTYQPLTCSPIVPLSVPPSSSSNTNSPQLADASSLVSSRISSKTSERSLGLSEFITTPATRRVNRLPHMPWLLVHRTSGTGDIDGSSDSLDGRRLPLNCVQQLRYKYAKAKVWMRDFLHNLCLFLFMFVAGVLESLISYLMRLSRDYRYIAYILREEKRIHKEMMSKTSVDHHMSRADRQHHREIIDQTVQESTVTWRSGVLRDESFQRLHRCLAARRKRAAEERRNNKRKQLVVTETRTRLERRVSLGTVPVDWDKKKSSLQRADSPELFSDDDPRTRHSIAIVPSKSKVVFKSLVHLEAPDTVASVSTEVDFDKDSAKKDEKQPLRLQHNLSTTSIREEEKRQSILVRLIVAIYYAILSRSEMICYVIIVLNHIFTASLLSMPLPLMVLLWGTLTVPKPTKRFWIVLITYTECMVVLKYVFQFGFFPWIHSAPSLDPFWPPRIIGIEKRQKYAAWDLALLMALFLHRNILMSIGLWKNEAELEAEEEKEERHHIFINKLQEQQQHDVNDDADIATALANVAEEGDADIHRHNSARNTSIITMLAQRSNFRVQSFAGMVSELRFNRTKLQHKVRRRVCKLRSFFGLLLNSEEEDRYPVDVYAPMFICDAICFLIVIFGYSSFGTDQGAGSVTAYFQENKVPGTLVAMLIIQFILMVIDRALFLRKFLFGKLCFQIFLVVFVHIWMFLLLPAATGRLFTKNFACQLWYFVKIIYFIISAKQIRAGYPKRQLENVISNSYSAVYMFLYKIYMMIPFLFELSLLMDWMWIDTCLGLLCSLWCFRLSNWITLHDIYSNVSMIKCERNIEEDYPSPKGVKQRALHKYGRGGFLLFLIILIIWFPLVLFSMANTVGTRSVPVECTAKLTISGYQPLFESTARLSDIRSLTVDEYNDLYYTYRMSKTALSYIADYDNEDVVLARIDGNSSSRWQISPPARKALINNLNSSRAMSIQFDWQFKRAPDENLQYGGVENFRVIELEPGSAIRAQLVEVINKSVNRSQILIPHLFPSMVEVPGEGKSDSVNALLHEHLKSEHDPLEKAFTSVLLDLDADEGIEWWKIHMIDPVFDPIRVSEPIVRDYMVFYGFVDKVFPKSFSFITGGGILGLYVSIVLVLGHYVRGIVSDSMKKVMFEELPNVDRLLQLCNDIFLVRDAGEFGLEEDLFAKLVFIFRSPATLIKWTREHRE